MNKWLLLLMILIFISYSLLWADPPNWQVISGTQYSMVMLAQATIYGLPFMGENDSIVGAFGPGGDTDCRALGLWQSAMPPEDGFWYFTIVGNDAGDLITFQLYDTLSDEIFICNETLIFEDNLTVGSTSEPFQLTVQNSYISGSISLLTATLPAGSLTDVTIQCDGQTTNPDINGNYQFVLSSGSYDIIAFLSGYTEVTLTDVVLQGSQSVNDANITLIDWVQIPGTQYSMVLMTTAEIFGESIEGGRGNLLAAFGPGGAEDCRGIAEWQQPNTPFWDGYWYFTIVGNNAGELISFQIFQNDSNTIFECSQNINFVDNETIGSPENPFNISNGSSQTFDFQTNWNWISFNIIPDQTEIAQLFSPIANDISQLKSQYESAVYFSPSGNWIGDLSNITAGEGYLIQMNNPVNSFQVNGSPILASTPISLDANWNWIAYYPQFSLELNVALNSIEENVFQVKNQNQSSTYINPPGSWQGDLDIMEPGQCYKVSMNSADELIYIPAETFVQEANNDIPMFETPDWSMITGTQYSMILMTEIHLGEELFTNEGENMVAAFGPNGDEDCRSIALWQEANPPFYDGFWYFTIVGNDNGDAINFKLYQESSDQIFECNEVISFVDNETIGSPDGPFQLTSDGTGLTHNLLSISENIGFNIYPNPFNPSTTISFNLTTKVMENIDISIYNLRGQKIKTFATSNSTSMKLTQSIIWNGVDDNNQTVSSGVYFVKLQAGNEIRTKKIMLLK